MKGKCNIILFDKAGHGLSETTEIKNGLHDYVADAISLMDLLKVQKCTIVGLSVGGMIALLLAHRYSERIEQLILCDTRHIIGTIDSWNIRIDQVKSAGVQNIADAVMSRWFPATFHTSHAEIVQGCKNMLQRNAPEGYIQCCQAIQKSDLTDVAGKVRQPCLIIVGSEDGSTPPDDVRSLHELMPGSKFVIMNGSGHIPCVDNPEALSKLIADFIK